jgi:hypothetical protein
MSATERDLRQANDKLELWKATAQGLADRVVRQESELAAVKQTMGELCESCGWAMRLPDQPCRCELERELTEAREKRDEALSDLEFRRELYVILAERCDRRTVELAETRNQRNTLAEVLERVNECLSNAEDVMHGAGSDDVSRSRRVISDTLAAVKGGTP